MISRAMFSNIAACMEQGWVAKLIRTTPPQPQPLGDEWGGRAREGNGIR